MSISISVLLYDWRFTRQSVCLGAKPLWVHDQRFSFRLNPCGHSPYVTSLLTRRLVCVLWICFAFVKCMYRTYSMLLKNLPCALYTSSLSVQADCKNTLLYGAVTLQRLLYSGLFHGLCLAMGLHATLLSSVRVDLRGGQVLRNLNSCTRIPLVIEHWPYRHCKYNVTIDKTYKIFTQYCVF
jgi:hypothetical protein